MDLRQLRSFAALAEEQHFGRAAVRLHVSQPALSQQVKQLEHELGLALVNRSTRRVELTEAGRRLAAHARTVLAAADRAAADMAHLASGLAGRVSAGFVGTATYDLLPLAAREVRADLPDVQLDVHGELLSPQLVAGLVDGEYDLVVLRPDGLDRPDVDVRILRRERLVAALPDRHPLAGRRRIDLALLAGEPFVMHFSRHRSSMHERVLAACAAAGFRPASIMEVGETATLVVFVAAGLGVALVPEPVRSLDLDGVSYVALNAAPTIELALALRAGETSPAVRRVADIVAGSCTRSRR
ncbi:LysR family transcriptional regulator [Actinoplanes sp. NPDC051411]|uniref:LysR family transcriptional regulator n=1 Tax=Actinoplanes sp. NPDC051411 TaxID=3155522 RepID=UPI00344A2FDA